MTKLQLNKKNGIIALVKEAVQNTEGDLDAIQKHGETALDEKIVKARLVSLKSLLAAVVDFLDLPTA